MATTRRDPQVVYIVARDEQALYERLIQNYSGIDAIAVVLDRRLGPRRRTPSTPRSADRRKADRRSRAALEAHLRSLGYAVLRARPARPA